MSRRTQIALVALTALSLSVFLAATTNATTVIEGRVVSVADGDTITVLDAARRPHRIRLAEIDAPEKRQPFGKRSKQSLSDMVYGQRVKAVCPTRDRYRRYICRVYVGGSGLDVNAAQVERGMAWVYRRYASDPALYRLELEARTARRGLWSDPKPVPPWSWRRGRR